MVVLINPMNGEKLKCVGDCLVDIAGNSFPIIRNVPRIAPMENYTQNFGLQWNKFANTQLDCDRSTMSASRFFAETQWNLEYLANKDALEVGCGAGRFSKVVLEHTKATLWSVDYSDAVTANFLNNSTIDPQRFHLFQASIYELPFPDYSFDKVFCFGVLQHTPDFAKSVKSLIDKAKPGGEIVVDFYPIKGWWTKLCAKYLLRPFTKRMNHAILMNIISTNIRWLINVQDGLYRIGLGAMVRFLPVANIQGLSNKLSTQQRMEWGILDTFDMFSPDYDNPQRVKDVAAMFEQHGASVTYAGFVSYDGGTAAVVRGIKRT